MTRPAWICLVAMTLSVLLPVGDAFAQRAQRGSVRSTNQSSGTRQRATTQALSRGTPRPERPRGKRGVVRRSPAAAT